jgi:hypothetical protein
MKSRTVLKTTLTVLLVLGLLGLPQAALAWGTATHIYIAKRLGQQLGYANTQEMYGASLADFPTLMFGSAYQQALYLKTHQDFMRLVHLAPLGYKRALAYGFASHNEKWGADRTAHIEAITLGPDNGGYVNAKVVLLAPSLEDSVAAVLIANGVPEAEAQAAKFVLARTLADSCIEAAVDLLVSQREFKEAGVEMMLASGLRAPFAPELLVSAYGAFAPAAVITSAEAKNREYLATYGAVLTQPNRLDLLSEVLAQLAETMLAAQYGRPFEVPSSVMKGALVKAIDVVGDDYSGEVAATLEQVGRELRSHFIFTSLVP